MTRQAGRKAGKAGKLEAGGAEVTADTRTLSKNLSIAGLSHY